MAEPAFGVASAIPGTVAVGLVVGVRRLRLRRRRQATALDDVVGADDTFARLREVVGRLADGAGGPSGILLHGAEGVGKRLLAGAVAADARVRLVETGAGGEPGALLDERVDEACAAAPAVLVLDGVEHAMPGTVQRILGHFDRMSEELVPVVVVGITTDAGRVDPALCGPACFSERIAVESLTVGDRTAVLRSLTAELPLDIGVDLTALAHRTAGFTRSELAQAVRIADAAARDRSRTSMIVADDLYAAVAGVVSRRALTGADPDGELRTRAAYRAAAQVVVVAALAPDAVPDEVSIAEWRSGLGSGDLTSDLLAGIEHLAVVERLSVAIAPVAGERVALGKEAQLDDADIGVARTVALDSLTGADPGHAFKRLLEDAFALALKEVRRGQVELHQLALALLSSDTIDAAVIGDIVGSD